jgi:hypothetical protein
MFAAVLVRKLVEEAKTRPELEHAVEGTKIRHSDAAGCARKIGLKIAGYKSSDPMDAAGLWVTNLGSMIHEAMQEALEQEFPGQVQSEYTVTWDDLSASGHLDALVTLPSGYKLVWELKTMGGFGFDKSIGLNRKAYKLSDKGPEGPRVSAKIQGALNSLAADADELRISHVSMESISKQLAEKVKFNDEQRFLAEWKYTRDEFEPWALAEKARWKEIIRLVDKGILPDRYVVQDDMTQIKLDPIAAKPAWNCSYCSHLDLCKKFGPGEVAL